MNNSKNTQNNNVKNTQNDFISNLERASNTVKAWPEWKQNVWGSSVSVNSGHFINNK